MPSPRHYAESLRRLRSSSAATTVRTRERFPDARRSFFDALETLFARRASGRHAGRPLRVALPLADKDKAETVRLGLDARRPVRATRGRVTKTPSGLRASVPSCAERAARLRRLRRARSRCDEAARRSPALTSADVCVIGGGMTGCAAALELARAGRRVVVARGGHGGRRGPPGRNLGHVAVGLGSHYSRGHRRARAATAPSRCGRRTARTTPACASCWRSWAAVRLRGARRLRPGPGSRGGAGPGRERGPAARRQVLRRVLRPLHARGALRRARLRRRLLVGGRRRDRLAARSWPPWPTRRRRRARGSSRGARCGALARGPRGVGAWRRRRPAWRRGRHRRPGRLRAVHSCPFLAERIRPLRGQCLALATEIPLRIPVAGLRRPRPRVLARCRRPPAHRRLRRPRAGGGVDGGAGHDRRHPGEPSRPSPASISSGPSGTVVARWSGIMGISLDGFPFVGADSGRAARRPPPASPAWASATRCWPRAGRRNSPPPGTIRRPRVIARHGRSRRGRGRHGVLIGDLSTAVTLSVLALTTRDVRKRGRSRGRPASGPASSAWTSRSKTARPRS